MISDEWRRIFRIISNIYFCKKLHLRCLLRVSQQHNKMLKVYSENTKTECSICPNLLLFPTCLINQAKSPRTTSVWFAYPLFKISTLNYLYLVLYTACFFYYLIPTPYIKWESRIFAGCTAKVFVKLSK